ncbi:MAG TPA: hypothetical protein VLA42_16150 [Verrucomicrobiae bacterium]|jgi:hypothetical protein|nr:hypothetical protein [Verrucomicrobiae bacterium]
MEGQQTGKTMQHPGGEIHSSSYNFLWKKELLLGGSAGGGGLSGCAGPEVAIQRVSSGLQDDSAVRATVEMLGDLVRYVGR